MRTDQVLEMLSGYNAKKGRFAYLQAQIEDLERDIRVAYATLVSNNVLNAPGQDGMPRGNEISKTVENLAVKLADGWIPRELEDMSNDLNRLQQERDSLRGEIVRMDAWLQALNDRQRFVLERQVMQQESWREVSMEYRQRFGSAVSKDTLKRLKMRACEVVQELSEKQERMSVDTEQAGSV